MNVTKKIASFFKTPQKPNRYEQGMKDIDLKRSLTGIKHKLAGEEIILNNLVASRERIQKEYDAFKQRLNDFYTDGTKNENSQKAEIDRQLALLQKKLNGFNEEIRVTSAAIERRRQQYEHLTTHAREYFFRAKAKNPAATVNAEMLSAK